MKKTAAGLLVGFFFFAAFPAAVFASVSGLPMGSNWQCSTFVMSGSGSTITLPATLTATFCQDDIDALDIYSGSITDCEIIFKRSDNNNVFADGFNFVSLPDTLTAGVPYSMTFSSMNLDDQFSQAWLACSGIAPDPHTDGWAIWGLPDSGPDVFLTVGTVSLPSGNPVGSNLGCLFSGRSTGLSINSGDPGNFYGRGIYRFTR